MKGTCIICGAAFEKRGNGPKKTCTPGCAKQAKANYMRAYFARPDRQQIETVRAGKRQAARFRITVNCEVCGKEFRKVSRSLVCSEDCWESRLREHHKTPAIPPLPQTVDRVGFGHWLSGFVDGEGCFKLSFAKSHRSLVAQPRANFAITLRDDDSEILHFIQSYWGCGLVRFFKNNRAKTPNAKPIAALYVNSYVDMAKILIPHFEAFPLRAKKRRDYLTWRVAVELLTKINARPLQYRPGHCPNRHGGTFPKWTDAEREHFSALVTRLKETRRYPGGTTPNNDQPKTLVHEPATLVQKQFFGDHD